ncbi:MAG: hypothetical protein IT355_03175 [Gemmatimonadaceae bacterium]|nr:hypothetical protein [Gemmatimonadaceae bacterium]
MHFALTAAHVTDWAQHGELVLGGSTHFFTLPTFSTTGTCAERSRDWLDAAVVQLPDEIAEDLRDIRWIEMKDICLAETTSNAKFWTILGYPVAHQNRNDADQSFHPKMTIFTGVELEPSRYRAIGEGAFNAQHHVAIKFRPDRVLDIDGLYSMKKQNGISGGGVWMSQSLSSPNTPDLLAAISIYGQTKGTRALVATRIEYFLAMIFHESESLRNRYVRNGVIVSTPN